MTPKIKLKNNINNEKKIYIVLSKLQTTKIYKDFQFSLLNLVEMLLGCEIL